MISILNPIAISYLRFDCNLVSVEFDIDRSEVLRTDMKFTIFRKK